MPRHDVTTRQQGYFLYSRKSTEAEDRQILSIDSQVDEVKRLAERVGLPILEVFSEARSAKAPGRPVFEEMMRRIHAGDALGILCWKLDRLARNPVDGGSVIWAVKEHGIRIVTPTQAYSQGDDNIILMYIEFGMAHKYIDDLSRVVKRGLQAKASRGWLPSSAPLGYLNRVNTRSGLKEIIRDPERFPIVRKMWELMLTGAYSPDKIRALVNGAWGFRNRAGQPLPRSTLYYLLTNPFYAGHFEYPLRSGRWFRGRHEPVVTEAEYDRVQALLGSKGNPRLIKRVFAYTGLIRCGFCRAMITAEEKHQLICGACRYKFVHRGKDRCPRCSTTIRQMLDGGTPRKPLALHYIYYHCTKRTNRSCPERAVRVEHLETELANYLGQIEMPEAFQRWVLARLRRSQEAEASSQQEVRRSQETAYKACIARLENLVKLKTAPENGDGSLLGDAEYAHQRAELLKTKGRLEAVLQGPANSVAEWGSLVGEVFDFARHAQAWLRDEDPETKRLLLAVLHDGGSNLTLTHKTLRIDAPKPFPFLAAAGPVVAAKNRRFEPKKNGFRNAQSAPFGSGFRAELGDLDDVRTYGEDGVRLVRALTHWLQTTPADELRGLRAKLRNLFQKTQTPRRAA